MTRRVSISGNQRFRRHIPRLLLIALMAVMALIVGSGANAATGARWSRMIVAAAQSESLSEPVPINTEIAAGPWRMTVLGVTTGDDATNMVTGASPFNESPAGGFTYVVVHLRVTNVAEQPFRIDGDDFGVVGSSGIVRRFTGAIPPEPRLDGSISPGDTAEGYVVGGASSEDAELILLYDSITLSGNWADAAFALTDGASLPAADSRAVKANKIGREPLESAGFDTVVATRDWSVEILEVVWGEDVINLFPSEDYRTIALIGNKPSVAATWMAFWVRITNNQTGNEPAYLPATAFMLTDGNGDPVPDVGTLSPPYPDAAGWYFPGASREGWVVFDPIELDVSLLRFLPYRTGDDPRYFTWSGGGVTTAEPSFTGTLVAGMKVTVTEDLVRMRAEPSTDAAIVAELVIGTELTVTGGPVEGGGFIWYPVKNESNGDTGYVAQQFLDPVE